MYPCTGFRQRWGNVAERCKKRFETLMEAGFEGKMAGSKRVQVKGGMLLLAAYPWKTPTGKAVREIWFEYFWKRRSKEWCWIFESGRILEEMRESL